MTRRKLTVVAWAGASSVVLCTGLGAGLLKQQARSARRAIGKPLGEQAHAVDGAYKKKYGDPLHLLLLGDSIAAGLGAERPADTLGAQLSERLAKATRRTVRLHTGAIVGSETSMLRAQLAGLPAEYHADVAVILVGGNDVTHMVKTAVSRDHLAEAVAALQDRGTAVVVGTCPDLGALGLVPQPLRSLVSLSSRQLASAQRDAVVELGGRAVSLAQVVGPFFVAQPDAMFAIDRFHPSGVGYRRTAKALLPSVLAAVGEDTHLPFGHHGPLNPPVVE